MIQIAAVQMIKWIPRSLLVRQLGKIDPIRAARLQRLHLDEDLQRGIVGPALVSHLVRRIVQCGQDILQFGTSEFGKPYLLQYPDLHFNLSHSGDWVVCSVSSLPVGIDVEEKRPVEFEIARRFFSRYEYEELMQMKQADRIDHFYNLWTVKESYVKMNGIGLSQSLDTFTVIWHDQTDIGFVQDDLPVDGVVASVSDALENHKLAVCAHVRPDMAKLEIISMECLI